MPYVEVICFPGISYRAKDGPQEVLVIILAPEAGEAVRGIDFERNRDCISVRNQTKNTSRSDPRRSGECVLTEEATEEPTVQHESGCDEVES